MKLLLYAETMREFDLNKVKLRRRPRKIHRSATEASDKSNLSRQDAFDRSEDDDDESASTSDAGSSEASFGFMRFRTGKKATLTSDTDYETFIDYGVDAATDCTKQIFEDCSKRLTSSISINRDSDGSFIAVPQKKQPIELRDSLPMYSKPVKKVIAKTPSRDSVVHVSTARLQIGLKKMEVDEESNFEERCAEGRHMACEDLVNLNDSLIIANPLQKRAMVDERHSMPTLFVGNRFNSSDMTEVYIPSYKDKAVINKPEIESSPSSASTTTHSSSMDLPAMVPVPDRMNVELLYNFNQSPGYETLNEMKMDIIKPPTMFDNSDRISLTKDVSPFNKHLLNSDKKIIPARQSASKENSPRRSDSMKRCISYQYLRLKYNAPKDDQETSKKCACCSSSRCPSPRSSDSGVAGSCTISSPDAPQNAQEHEFLQNFGSALRHSNSSHNFGRFGTMSFVENELEHDHDSGQFGDIGLTKDDEPGNPMGFDNMFELSTSRDTVKRQTRCQSAERSMEANNRNANGNKETVFKTGLYAHWWKKEKLPTSMLRDLIVSKPNRTLRPLNEWGSGKRN